MRRQTREGWARLGDYFDVYMWFFSGEPRTDREKAPIREFLRYLGVGFTEQELLVRSVRVWIPGGRILVEKANVVRRNRTQRLEVSLPAIQDRVQVLERQLLVVPESEGVKTDHERAMPPGTAAFSTVLHGPRDCPGRRQRGEDALHEPAGELLNNRRARP